MIGRLPREAPDAFWKCRNELATAMGTMQTVAKTLDAVLSAPLNRGQRGWALWNWARWHVRARLAAGPVRCRFVDDAVLLVSAGEAGVTGNVYMGLMEYEDMAFVLHVLAPDGLFVDVGAHSGAFTVLAAKAVGGRAVAIEPAARTFARLEANVAANGIGSRVRRHNVAVGAASGTARMTDGRDAQERVLAAGENMSGAAPTVALDTLDRLLALEAPTMIKIDVEGYELQVLKGATRVLAGPALEALIVEMGDGLGRYGDDEGALFALLAGHGFKPAAYDPAARRLASIPGRNPRSNNTLFVRDFEAVNRRAAVARRFRVHNRLI